MVRPLARDSEYVISPGSKRSGAVGAGTLNNNGGSC